MSEVSSRSSTTEAGDARSAVAMAGLSLGIAADIGAFVQAKA